MFRSMVHFSQPTAYRIYQQENGTADIEIEGTVTPEDGRDICPNPDGFFVMLALLREEDGTYVRLWERAEMEGNTFRHTFDQVPAGGLYTIQSIYTNTALLFDGGYCGDCVKHLGVGDLYVIAGQSNAVGYGRTPAYDPSEIGIHSFCTDGRWDTASRPLNDATDSTRPVMTDVCLPAQSPFLTFAKTLHRVLHYPIGLIPTALGGSPLDAWNKRKNGPLYQNMLETVRLCGGKICGVLWYQGCTDGFHVETAETYYDRFVAMVSDWREDLGDPTLPFFTVQLNRIIQPRMVDSDRGWSLVRDAQRRAAHLPHIYVSPAIDLMMSDRIHNSAAGNVMLGERMAHLALRREYGLAYLADAPTIDYATLRDQTLTLHFRDVSLYLVSLFLPMDHHPFVVEDELGEIPLRDYHTDGSCIHVILDRAAVGTVTVSAQPYAFTEPFMPIDRGTGMPILLFDRIPISVQASNI